MIRKIIKIDEEKCNGCGLCAQACHEGAIGMVEGKAKLLRDDYCDGLGDCLPVCPTGAITFEEREAADYNREAVEAKASAKQGAASHGCPGSAAVMFERNGECLQSDAISGAADKDSGSKLSQWPVQIKLVAPNAAYFDGADLLIAADCTAYAYGNFHNDFIKNKVCIVGCPKLDMVDYTEKLAAIISDNDIKSMTVARMEVPCCGGIENAAKEALKKSGKFIPWQIVTISTDGRVLD